MRQLFITLVFASAVSLSQAADMPRASTVPSVAGLSIAYEVHGRGSPARFNRSPDSVVKRLQQ